MRPGSASNSSNKSGGGTMVNTGSSGSSVASSSSSTVPSSNNKSDSASIPGHGENIAYSPFAIGHNHHLIEYCRTSMSALAGSTAGIVGLTSLQGFAFFLVMVVILWLLIIGKAGPNYNRYFTSRWSILTNGFLGGLTTYVLFWTFLYGMVHVY